MQLQKAYVEAIVIQVMNTFANTGKTFTSPTTGTVMDIDGNIYHTIKLVHNGG